jgi:LPS-assembly protein
MLVCPLGFGQQSGLNSFFRVTKDKKLFAPKVQTQSLPASADPDRELEIIRYGTITIKGQDVTLGEGVELTYKGFRCLADSAEGNRESQIFRFVGNVRIIGSDSTVVGESVTVNFKNRTFSANYGTAQVKPALVNNQVTGDVYLKGRKSFGDSKRIKGEDCEFTTCDRKDPHFHIDGKTTDLEPGKQVVFKDVRLQLFNRTILRLPILWIPLGDRSYKYLPQVGQSPDEGFFVKNTYGFPMRGEDRGSIRTDWMQRIGTGLGANYFYRNKESNGITRAYGISGRTNTFTLNNQHEQRIGSATLTLDNDYQQNNYLTVPGSEILNSRAQLQIQNTQFGFNRQSQKSNGFNSFNETYTLNDQRRWRDLTTNLNTTLNRSASSSAQGSSSGRETMDVRFNSQKEFKSGTLSLDYQRTIPVGDVQDFFPGSDQAPVFSFKSDSRRLLGSKAPKNLPFRTEISHGEFLDPIRRQRVQRQMFDLNFNRAAGDKGNWRWDLNGQFRQNFYSDETAQYRLQYGSALTYQIKNSITANLRYSYLKPFGFTPLAIDRTGTTDLFTFDVSWQKNSKSSFGLQTGYDVIRSDRSEVPWQQVGIRSDYRLGGAFSFRTLSSYDTVQQLWSNVRIDTTWQTPTLQATLGTRYDAQRQVWSNINFFLDGAQYGKTRFGTAFNYNGFTKQLDSLQYNLVYSLHCAEAILTISEFNTGFRTGREIGFFIRLKSVPFDTNFGRGRLGQALGSGTGRDF